MSHRASRYTYLLLFLFPFILFSPIILTGRAIFWGTPITQFIPWWTLAWRLLENGILPLWNPLLGMGAPLLANYQTALLYPPTWIYFLLYKLGDVPAMAWGQAMLVVMHLFWAGLGMALFIRRLGLGRLAQIIAGLAFSLSGYLVSRAGFLSINAAAAWIPWVLLAVTKLADSIPYPLLASGSGRKFLAGKRGLSILSAALLTLLVLSLQLLSGHAQTAWYTLILAWIWFGFLVISNIRRPMKEIGEQNQEGHQPGVTDRIAAAKYIIMMAFILGIVVLFSVAVSAGQLLPTGEYLLQSQRSSEVDYEFAMTYSFWPWRFLTFLAPDLFGNPVRGDYWGYANYWEDAIYFGLIPFMLAVFALITRGKFAGKNRYVGPGLVGFLFSIIVIAFLVALGRNTPIFPWLYANVFTFDMFQAPTRISIIAIFCLTVLAAIGAESWRRPREKALYWVRLGVMAAAAITVGAFLALLLSRSVNFSIKPSFIRAAAFLGIWGIGLGLLTLKAPKTSSTGQDQKWRWWHWAVMFWVGADLLVAGWGLNPGVDLSVYSNASPNAETIASSVGEGRLYLSAEDEYELKYNQLLRFDTFQPFEEGKSWDNLREILLPNVNILDGVPSVNNFDPLIPSRYSNWMDLLGEVNFEKQEQMLNIMGVSVVEMMDPNSSSGVRFESRQTYPRLRWSSCGIPAVSGEEALALIRQNQIDFGHSVLIENDNQKVCNDESDAEIMVTTNQADHIILSINSSAPGYVVFADAWYPGWRALIDSELVPIQRANYLFRAVEVPEGEHEVAFEFRSNTFNIGIIISGISLIALISLISYWFIASRIIDHRDEVQ